MADPGAHAMMVYWVKQQKLLEQKRDKALEDGKVWFKRAKLAMNAGKMDMAAEAKQEAMNARMRYEMAVEMLADVQEEKRALQMDTWKPDTAGLQRAHHLMDQFKELGIDPEMAQLEDAYKDVGATDALDALRARMQMEGDGGSGDLPE